MNCRFVLLAALAVASASCSTDSGPSEVVADRSNRVEASHTAGASTLADSTDLSDTDDGEVAGVDLGSGGIASGPSDAMFWVSDSTWDDDESWSDLAAAFPETGLWPLQLEFLTPDDGRPWRSSEFGPSEETATSNVADILTAWSATGPVDELADAVQDPTTTAITPSGFGFEPAALGLVPVERPADVIARIGWWGAANYDQSPAELSAVLRSWEERFGAHVTRLGFSSMYISVTRPPTDRLTTQALAVEHYAWCPALAEFGIPIDEYAAGLDASLEWFCWWD